MPARTQPTPFTKRIRDVFDGGLNRVAAEVGETDKTLWKILKQLGV